MKPLIPALFTLSMLILSCSKERQSSADKQLVGQWTWQSTSVGSPQNTLTPQSTGVQETLTLNSDKSWSKVKNGAVVDNGSFRTSVETSTRGEKVNAIHYRTTTRSTDSTAYYSANDSVLIFSNDFMGTVGAGVRIYTKH